MTIKEAREKMNFTRPELFLLTGIPVRTLEEWESGRRTPSEWTEKMVIEKILSLKEPQHKIYNQSVQRYVDCCKKFSADSAEWGGLSDYNFYSTNGISDWTETCDNAGDGIDLRWAFHLSEKEIEQRAAEELFERLVEEIQLAVDDEWSLEDIQYTLNKFSFK